MHTHACTFSPCQSEKMDTSEIGKRPGEAVRANWRKSTRPNLMQFAIVANCPVEGLKGDTFRNGGDTTAAIRIESAVWVKFCQGCTQLRREVGTAA